MKIESIARYSSLISKKPLTLWERPKNMENENFKEGISLLEDAGSNLKSEHVKLNQLDALEKVSRGPIH